MVRLGSDIGGIDLDPGETITVGDQVYELTEDGELRGVGSLSIDEGGIGHATIDDIENDDRHHDPGSTNKLVGPVQNQMQGAGFRTWAMESTPRATHIPYEREKARVSFSFDGSAIEDYEDVFPVMHDNGIPWTGNWTASRIENDKDSHINKAQTDEMVVHGAEVGNYAHDEGGRNMGDMEDDEIIEMLAFNRRDLEDLGYSVTSMKARQGAGININRLDDPRAHAIRSTHVTDGGGFGPGPEDNLRPALPLWHGRSNYLMENKSAEEIKSFIDRVVAIGGSAQLFTHTGTQSDAWDPTIFQEVVEYVAQLRDDGDLEVATKTGQVMIPRELDAYNAAPDPTFEAVPSTEDLRNGWSGWDHTGDGPILHDDGAGYVGDSYAEVGDTGSLFLIRTGLAPMYSTIMAEVVTRAPTGESGDIYVEMRSGQDRMPDGRYERNTTDEWERFYFPFGYHRYEDYDQILIGSDSASQYIDDIKIYPV